MNTGAIALVVIAVVVLFIVFNMRNRYECNNLQSSSAYVTDIKNAVTVPCSNPLGRPLGTLTAAIKACEKNSSCKQVMSVKVGKAFRYQMCASESKNCSEQCCNNCTCPGDCSTVGATNSSNASLMQSGANYVKDGSITGCVQIMEKNKALVFSTFSAALGKMKSYNANRDKIIKANAKLAANKKKPVPVECVSITSVSSGAPGSQDKFALCSRPANVNACQSEQTCQNDCSACDLTCTSPQCTQSESNISDEFEDAGFGEFGVQTTFVQAATPVTKDLYKFVPAPPPVSFESPHSYQTLRTPSVMLAPATYEYKTPKYTYTEYVRPSFVTEPPITPQQLLCNTQTSIPDSRRQDELFYQLSIPTNSQFTFSSTLNPQTNKHEINLKEALGPLLYANMMDNNAILKWDVISRMIITNTTHFNDPKNNVDLDVQFLRDPNAVLWSSRLENVKVFPKYDDFLDRTFINNSKPVADANSPAKKFTTWYDSHPKNPANTTRESGFYFMFLNRVYNFLQMIFSNNIENVPFTLTVTLGTLLAEPGYIDNALHESSSFGTLTKNFNGTQDLMGMGANGETVVVAYSITC